jgi:hypothetical protein
MTNRPIYRVWVDETGDRGCTPGASPFFAFAAVVIRADQMPRLQAAKAAINVDLEKPPGQELHWSKNHLRSHDARMVATEALAKLPVRILYSVVEKATLPAGSHLVTDTQALYNYPLRLLLERASWLVDDAGGVASITLSAVKGLPKRIPVDYINRLNGRPDVKIRWNAIHPNIHYEQAATRDGLQMADIAAGALDRAIKPHKAAPHRMEPTYLRLLLPRVYCRAPGKIASYGLKAIDPAMWEAYPWWPEAKALGKNG